MIEQYIEKEVTVEVVQWTGENVRDVMTLTGIVHFDPDSRELVVRSIDGCVVVDDNHYVVKCNKGYKEPQIYVYSEEDFNSKY